MSNKSAVDDFIAQDTLAVVGVSRNKVKFGNVIYKTLKEKGYHVFPINPNAESILGDRCYPNLTSLPEKVDGVVVVVPPAQTEQVVKDAKSAGIQRVWMQHGAASAAAIRFCQENGLQEVHGECIIMFAAPKQFPHSMHRWVWGLIGKLPK